MRPQHGYLTLDLMGCPKVVGIRHEEMPEEGYLLSDSRPSSYAEAIFLALPKCRFPHLLVKLALDWKVTDEEVQTVAWDYGLRLKKTGHQWVVRHHGRQVACDSSQVYAMAFAMEAISTRRPWWVRVFNRKNHKI